MPILPISPAQIGYKDLDGSVKYFGVLISELSFTGKSLIKQYNSQILAEQLVIIHNKNRYKSVRNVEEFENLLEKSSINSLYLFDKNEWWYKSFNTINLTIDEITNNNWLLVKRFFNFKNL